jgi:chromosome segregation ATPase
VCGHISDYGDRIEQPQQASDSEPETMEDLRKRLAECEVLLAEADRGGQQVNAELQQLRERLATSHKLAETARRQVKDEAGKVERLKEQVRDLTRQTQVDALELQQLREQVATLTQELKDKNDTYQLCLQNHYKAGQRSAIDKLQVWLRPVLEVVSDHPDHSSILAVSVLEFLPQIASRLIEE